MFDNDNKMSEFIADISNNVILRLAKSGKVLFVNNRAKCVFAQIKSNDNLKDYLQASDLYIFEKNIDMSLYNQHPHNFYFEYKQRFYIIYIYPEDTSVWLSFEDITEKRQLSHLLHINSERMLFSERNSKSGYWELDLQKKRFYWSKGVYDIFDVNEDFAGNKKNLIKDFVVPQDIKVYKISLKKLLEDKEKAEGFIRILSKNNMIKTCRFTADIFHENGEEKIAGVFVDVTDCIKNECEKCKFWGKDYGCIMAKSVHDIRQPICIIKLLAEKIKEALCYNDKILAEKLLSSCDSLSYLVEETLNFAKNSEIKYEKFNLKECVKKVCNEYETIIKNKNIKITLCLNDFEIIQSRYWVEKIIRNLLENAIKYTVSKIIIRNINSCFWIADNGCGIDKEYINHIFKDFFQCDTLINGNKQGVGLGLSIVDFASSLIGAKIKVKSRKKYYTIFRVCL